MKTLAPEEWIQFVLVPRLRDLASGKGELPASSNAAAWATRQFDGDPAADPIIELLRELDDLVDGKLREPSPTPGAAGSAPVATRAGGVTLVSGDAGAALFAAVAGSHPALDPLLTAPFDVDLASVGTTTAPLGPVAALLDGGVDPNVRALPVNLTPLMVATFFGHREVAELLVARGADPAVRDTLGRTAERFAVFPTIGRAIRLCRELDMVIAAYVAQIHAPSTHQYTTPMLGLQISQPLPGEAFAAWPAAEAPIVVFVLGDDPTSRLMRLAPPIYQRLTRDRLVVGRRYRVIASIQGLERGRVVRYDGLDDIDNHYGVYTFTDEHGGKLEVSGDHSSDHGPLADVAKFLVEA
jgi:hypothetical protein